MLVLALGAESDVKPFLVSPYFSVRSYAAPFGFKADINERRKAAREDRREREKAYLEDRRERRKARLEAQKERSLSA
jgi:hypothetical protein